MKLIAGLGNPGSGYARTRHNIGFRCVNRFAKEHGTDINQRLYKAKAGRLVVAGEQVTLSLPQTYMNASGSAISLFVKNLRIPLTGVLVVHDDLDLPLGKIRLRSGGGSGGHRGIESIIASLGTSDFSRLRVGIGRPEGNEDAVVSYVLSGFMPDELEIVDQTMTRVIEAIECFITQGIVATMNTFN